MLKVASCS
jgi:hypothetical protein